MKSGRAARGFTLLEVLFALSLFAIGLLAVASLQGTALRAAADAEQRAQARAAARSLSEHLLALPFDHPELRDVDGSGRAGLDDRDAEDSQADHRLEPPGQAGMRLFWNIAEEDPAPGLKTVRVIAVWPRRDGEQSLSLEFIRTAGF
ncbi:type IV pilus modification PilV family protein [Geoalkalibacter halelectricus]|uniref:Prepilin-type N-terminal cleavage/methylation domain-containing protein n=1 Tax=Geoalkalibacter halelectricus TaxID=2847045 RepID=A0ABY5ZLE3_9BACT|nr:prepilin-type N-terminal cleavage/methylation domain-containing protein [Geoalkalibacter halelectricus]MDO3377782.1 prepilin-type N-terminal cleavage/methylation domain-containing protein [Geoalkalibacter halelectricus]UWZ78625.1 prepilin-type N-terminal cleavage/methylation domain-containing protein [Geoalkalibacter halelectricus]